MSEFANESNCDGGASSAPPQWNFARVRPMAAAVFARIATGPITSGLQ
ncbi:hypothetical protein ACVILK_004826 [Bradyrhizobium embrapense]